MEFSRQLKLAGIDFFREVQVIPGRKYRFDFMIGQLLIEVQGGIWQPGGHSTGAGISRDAEKTILAQLEGYMVFPITAEYIKSGEALRWVQRAIKMLGE